MESYGHIDSHATVRPTDRTVLGKGRALEKALPYFR